MQQTTEASGAAPTSVAATAAAPVALSIVIPTFRRNAMLARAIESCRHTALAEAAEIVVVDNSPEAGARELVADLDQRSGLPVRYVHEARSGVAHARNAGIKAARGRYVAFLDDDEEAGQHWAAGLLKHAYRGAAAVFGAVEPVFDGPPGVHAEAATRLFSRAMGVADGADITSRHAYLGTGNSLFDKAACFTSQSPFAVELNGLGGEDSELLMGLVRRGIRLTWAADAPVKEHIPSDRAGPEALALRYFRNGQVRSLLRFRAGGLHTLEGLAWMGVGALQLAGFGLASLALSRFSAERAVRYRLRAHSGAGKLMWMPRFWKANYGATAPAAAALAPACTPSGTPKPLVSIIVVNYRTRDMTLECLRSVMRETHSTRYELLLVDNASGDGLVEAAAQEFPDVRVLALPENVGFARANNIAAEQARGSYLLLLNPDTVVLDRGIDRLVEFVDERPEAGIWGGRTLYGDHSLNPTSCWRRMTLWSIICRASGLSFVFPNSALFNPEAYGGWDHSSMRRVDIVTGCFLLIGRELWDRLGGFDAKFFMYGEEADLCLRAAKLGAQPVVTPRATIIHYGGASEQTEVEKLVRLLASKAELIKRHWSQPARRLGLMIFSFWPLSRALGFAVAALLSGGAPHRARAETWWGVWRRRASWRFGYQ